MSTAASLVVYVHGLWMPGGEAAVLQRRLTRSHGYAWHTLRYDSMRESIEQVNARLRAVIEQSRASHVHLLGHSLGGLVIEQYLECQSMSASGRVVFLGTPAAGSRIARQLARWALGRRLLGNGVAQQLLRQRQRQRGWRSARELGIIAGTVPLGMGQLLLRFKEPNDGTVALAETLLQGAKSHCALPVSHMGLLISARVARETGSFLEHGRFGL